MIFKDKQYKDFLVYINRLFSFWGNCVFFCYCLYGNMWKWPGVKFLIYLLDLQGVRTCVPYQRKASPYLRWNRKFSTGVSSSASLVKNASPLYPPVCWKGRLLQIICWWEKQNITWLMLSLRFHNFRLSLIIDFHQWLILTISIISYLLNILVNFFVLVMYYFKRVYSGFGLQRHVGSERIHRCSRSRPRPATGPRTVSPVPPSTIYGLEDNIYFSEWNLSFSSFYV